MTTTDQPAGLTPHAHSMLLQEFIAGTTSAFELADFYNLTIRQLADWIDHPQTQADLAALHNVIEQRSQHARAAMHASALQSLHLLSLSGPGTKLVKHELQQAEASRKAIIALLRELARTEPSTPTHSTTHPTTPPEPTQPARKRRYPVQRSTPGKTTPKLAVVHQAQHVRTNSVTRNLNNMPLNAHELTPSATSRTPKRSLSQTDQITIKNLLCAQGQPTSPLPIPPRHPLSNRDNNSPRAPPHTHL